MEEKKLKLTEYFIPFILQLLLLFILMFVHNISVSQGNLILKSIQIGDEMSSPTTGRLIYMIVAFIMFIITVIFANKYSKSCEKKKIKLSFWLGIISGTLLWQAIGEDSWNFGVQTENGFMNFSQLESISVILILAVFLFFLVYVMKQNALSFGVGITITSFLCNWLGHYVMLGTYPFVHTIFEERTWILLSGSVSGAIILIGSIFYVIKKADSIKERLFCSVMTYIAVGMIALAILEG